MAKTITDGAEALPTEAPLTEAPPIKAQPINAVPAEAPPTLTLEEWCRRASEGSGGVEMLAGFYADAMSVGLIKSTAAEFRAAYEAFGRRPA